MSNDALEALYDSELRYTKRDPLSLEVEEIAVHTVKLPPFLVAEPYFETNEKGKLIENSFTLKPQTVEKTNYHYGLAVFNFEGFKVIIYGKVSFVVDVMRAYYEHDVFEVGFDELLLFHDALSVRLHVKEKHLYFGLSDERTVHNGF